MTCYLTYEHTRIAYTIEALKSANPKTIKLSTSGKLIELEPSLPTRSFRNKFVLNAGEYLVRAFYGNSNAKAETRITVKAGQTIQHKIGLSAGRINLSFVLETGTPPLPGVFWSILDKSGKQIASASSISPDLTLSKGTYLVVADYLGQSYRQDFEIKSGDNKKIQLSLQ